MRAVGCVRPARILAGTALVVQEIVGDVVRVGTGDLTLPPIENDAYAVIS